VVTTPEAAVSPEAAAAESVAEAGVVAPTTATEAAVAPATMAPTVATPSRRRDMDRADGRHRRRGSVSGGGGTEKHCAGHRACADCASCGAAGGRE
jgi:hypothetical protein